MQDRRFVPSHGGTVKMRPTRTCASQFLSAARPMASPCRNCRSVGVLACGLWRRPAANFCFAHRDGAATRSRGRLRYIAHAGVRQGIHDFGDAGGKLPNRSESSWGVMTIPFT